MSTAADLLADLNDRLDDQGNTKFQEDTKIRWLNRGQAAMFPRIYRTARDSTLALIADTYEYNIPAAVGVSSKIIAVEIEDSNGRIFPLERYQILFGMTDPILEIKGAGLPSAVGANIRITAAMPLTAFVDDTSTYTGSAISEELPVLYAMAICAQAEIEQRMQHRRMPSIEGANLVTPEDQMTAAQFWMQQFQTLLEQLAMPLPAGF